MAGGVRSALHEQSRRLHALIGRVTGREDAKDEAYPDHTDRTYRGNLVSRRDAAAYGLSRSMRRGKIAGDGTDIGGDPIVAGV